MVPQDFEGVSISRHDTPRGPIRSWSDTLTAPFHVSVPIVAATPGGLAEARPTITARSLDRILPVQRVALLGSDLATALGVRTRSSPSTIFIDDVPFVVIGIIDRTQRDTDSLPRWSCRSPFRATRLDPIEALRG